nr:MAG TPA: hypothetical protein [Bacteriophage sp.]
MISNSIYSFLTVSLCSYKSFKSNSIIKFFKNIWISF